MRSTAGLIVGIWGVLLIGCGPERQLPDTSVVTSENAPVESIPSATDPEARKFVDRVLESASEKQPGRIAKLRAIKLSVKGFMRHPDTQALVDTRLQIEATWPDHFRYEYKFASHTLDSLTLGLNRSGVWIRRNQEGAEKSVDVPDPETYRRLTMIDVIGQLWMYTLAPLTDPRTIVYDLKPALNNPKQQTIKVAVPECPTVFTLTFSTETNQLLRIEYMYPSDLPKVRYSVELTAPKSFAGVSAPTQVKVSRNADPVEHWNEATWEFPEKLDSTRFDPPVAKK